MKKFIVGLCLGIGAGVTGRELMPALRRIGKPFVKVAIKGSIQALEKGIEVASQLSETLDDMVAEVRGEMDGPLPREAQQKRRTSKAPGRKKKKEAPANVAESHNQPSDQQSHPSAHTS
jgi:Protein of unknown function (DUF5132)